MSGRRTWDKDYFAQKARERAEKGDDAVDNTDNDQEGAAAKVKKAIRQEFQSADVDAAGPMGSQRAFLKSRDYKLGLDEKVGKIEVINPTAAEGNKAGFWCEVCSCLLKDSASYLDHINGKKRKNKRI